MQRTAGWVLLVVGILALGYGLGLTTGPTVRGILYPEPSTNSTGPASPSSDLSVSALGKLQPAAGILSVFGPPGDRVEKLFVTQGKTVSEKDPLVKLASAADRQKEAKLAKIQLDDAQNQLATLKDTHKVRLDVIEEQIKGLKAAREIEEEGETLKLNLLERQVKAAEDQQRRLASLDPTVVRVSAQERDQVELALAQARAELRGAEAARKAARRKYELALESSNSQKKAAAAEYKLNHDRVPIESLKETLTLANDRVERSTLKAPKSGRVLRILTREGDATGMEPILQIASGTRMAVVAEVYAADVDRLQKWLKAGKTVTAEVSSPTLGKTFSLKGEVKGENAVAPIVARNTVSGFSARTDSDRRVVEVRVELDETATPDASRFVGLEVNVELKPR